MPRASVGAPPALATLHSSVRKHVKGTPMTRKTLPLARQRNLGIIAHIDAGKTTLTERLLWKTGQLHRVGEVHDGTTVMDHMDLERERGITIGSAATQTSWRSSRHEEHRLTLIDTPGHIDFSIEVERSLRVLDGAVAVFCAVGGVQPQSETVWRQARRHRVPLMAFVNKMDRVGADFERVLEQMRQRLHANPVAVVYPLGAEAQFQGTLDLIDRTAWLWDEQGQLTVRAWTQAEGSLGEPWRQRLVEVLADHDDGVLESFLAGEDLGGDRLRVGLRLATLAGHLVPVLAGSAFKNKGIEPLLDAMVDFLPAPSDRPALTAQGAQGPEAVAADPDAPLAGLVFKVVEQAHGTQAFVRLYRGRWNTGDVVINASRGGNLRVGRQGVVMADTTVDIEQAQAGDIVAVFGWKDVRTGDTVTASGHALVLETIQTSEPVLAWRLSPARSDDLARLSVGLDKLTREDPSLRVGTDSQTGETVLWGMGELHLDVAVERLRREQNVQVQVGEPMVAYQETLPALVSSVEGLVSKQTGGKGQFARVEISLAPRQDGQVVFVDQSKGGVVPKEFAQAAEKGARDALGSGPRGYPVVGVTVTLLDGETHPVDSSAQAFHRAGSQAIKEGLALVGTTLLEPVMRVSVEVPASNVGDVIADLQRRLGQLEAMEEAEGNALVRALVPLAGLSGYATALRSLTQGRGMASLELEGYRPQAVSPSAKLRR